MQRAACEKYHIGTLKLCIERTNELCAAKLRRARAEGEARKSREAKHRQQVRTRRSV